MIEWKCLIDKVIFIKVVGLISICFFKMSGWVAEKNLDCESLFEQASIDFSNKKGCKPDLFVMQIALLTAASFRT